MMAVNTPENLRMLADQNLERRGRDTYVCPVCGSGNGSNHSAAFTVYNDGHWCCYACGNHGDIFDLYGVLNGIENYREQVDGVNSLFLGHSDAPSTTRIPRRKPVADTRTSYQKARDHEAGKLRAWQNAYAGSAGEKYAIERGIAGYPCRFGYDARRQRLIIPWPGNSWYHIDRDITDQHAHKYEKPRRDDVGAQPPFGETALDSDCFVVVEGALDAYALMSVGVEDVFALCGTALGSLRDLLVRERRRHGILLMLDNDEAGHAASERLVAELRGFEQEVTCFEWNEDDPKDADEAVREGMGPDLSKRVMAKMSELGEGLKANVVSSSMTLHDAAEVAEGIFLGLDAETPIPTGFRNFDELLGGGLMRGLYIIGATSSFGKTTFSEQVAAHIASSGHPTLFVTIEQSAQEIVAKSLSRRTHDDANSIRGGISAQEMLLSSYQAKMSDEQAVALREAVKGYVEQVAPNMRILEGVRKPTVADVRRAADEMLKKFHTAPVIFIDYLQLLSPANDRMTDKQAVDDNVTALRQLARDLKTPVWCVATLNRESYSGPVDFDSYKESGSIEYGADCLIGLQPAGIADEVAAVKTVLEKKLKGNAFVAKAKRDNPRQVELTLLKSRHTPPTGNDHGIPFSYYPRTNYFIETGSYR